MRTPVVVVGHPLAGLGEGDPVPLDEDRLHHLGRVLRRRDGDPVEATDGAGHRVATTLAGDRLLVTGAVESVPAPRPTVEVVHALPKGRGLDEVVRTLAELGVAAVHPVLTDRTESRPTGDSAHRATERWRAIARSAAEQAHSAHLCRVSAPVTLEEWLARDAEVSRRSSGGARGAQEDHELRVLAVPGVPTALGDVVAGSPDPGRAWLFVGPEGGLTDDEVAVLEGDGWVAARAGDTVLRSVHAATVLVAATLALLGRYGGS